MSGTPGKTATMPAGPQKGRRPNPRVASLRRTLYFLSRNTLAMIGLAVLILFVAMALYSFTYTAVPSDALKQYCGTDTGNGFQELSCDVCTYDPTLPAPSSWNPSNCYEVSQNSVGIVPPTINLATLKGGPLPLGSMTLTSSGSQFYSVYDGIVKGAPWSLGISVAIVGSGATIGLVLGSLAGYFGGVTDEVLMRFTDIFLSIPGLLLALVVLQIFGVGPFSDLNGRVALLIIAFVITWWPFYTRLVRGQVLVIREQKYVEASKASGARAGRILRTHVIPNSVFPVLVQLSLDVGTIPLLLGSIAFLGFHVFPTAAFPEWGTVAALSVEQAINFIQTAPTPFPWWQIVFPGMTLFMYAISVNFLSDGIRDAFDPRLRR
jgi:peptide/nickel transport system permease protein